MAHTCSGCPATWSGVNVCHCSGAGCHETFSGLTWYDAHRVNGKCKDPAKLKVRSGVHKGEPLLMLGKSGKWVGAGSAPEYWSSDA